MVKTAHKSAIDQAELIVNYLSATPSSSIDFTFLQSHIDELTEYAKIAKGTSLPETLRIDNRTLNTTPYDRLEN